MLNDTAQSEGISQKLGTTPNDANMAVLNGGPYFSWQVTLLDKVKKQLHFTRAVLHLYGRCSRLSALWSVSSMVCQLYGLSVLWSLIYGLCALWSLICSLCALWSVSSMACDLRSVCSMISALWSVCSMVSALWSECSCSSSHMMLYN